MKIGVYTDAHWMMISSIVTSSQSQTSTRLQMLIDSYKWMYDLFDKQGVDLIVDCGDLTNAPNLKAEEITALTEGILYSKGVPEKHIIGNHERITKEGYINSLSFLRIAPHIELIESPTKIDNLAFLPFFDEIDEEMVKPISADILFSHVTILGSKYSQFYVTKAGIPPEILMKYFKMVINGHIHTQSKINDRILNLGTLAGLSFADCYINHNPSVMVIDSNTLEYKLFENPHAIRFYKIQSNDMGELIKSVGALGNGRFALSVTVPIELRHRARDYLSNNEQVVASRISTIIKPGSIIDKVEIDKVSSLGSGSESLKNFYKGLADSGHLKFPLEDIMSVIDSL